MQRRIFGIGLEKWRVATKYLGDVRVTGHKLQENPQRLE